MSEERREELQKITRKVWELMDMFTILIVVMVSKVYTDVRIYQTVH